MLHVEVPSAFDWLLRRVNSMQVGIQEWDKWDNPASGNVARRDGGFLGWKEAVRLICGWGSEFEMRFGSYILV